GSVLVAGIPALLAYPSALSDYTGFRGRAGTLDLPELMINWRALILVYLPSASDRLGLLLTFSLGAATVALAAVVWRGKWAAQQDRFPAQVTVLMLATLLANYHSHGYGTLLLAAPVASLL